MKGPRVNNRIRANEVQLITHEGDNIGVVPIGEALDRAREVGLDLIEVAPNVKPPVCKIIDYGKLKYREQKSKKEAKKKQKTIEVKEIKMRINEMIEDLNLQEFLNKKTGELSSGQKNRVALAKSLINKPKLLFLDEPTASLDPDVGDFVREYIEKYKKRNSEITILLASHNMKEVERLCNKVVMMKQGKIVDSGTCDELIKKHGRENLEETFLKIARSKNELE